MVKRNFSFDRATDREAALGELHARPYPLVQADRIIIQLSFMIEARAGAHHSTVAEISRSRGVAPPDGDARHHAISWGQGALRWERHTEFTTWFWDGALPEAFGGEVLMHPFGGDFRQPGPFISGVRLEIRTHGEKTDEAIALFDPASLCFSELGNGQAAVVSDFRQDGDGLTRFLVIDRGLSDAGRGALAQRLLDIETYRTLAMLGLPLAQTLSPEVQKIESELTSVTQRMRVHNRQEAGEVLTDITRLAAALEANAASSLYRFGASRAYDGIVRERIAMLDEVQKPGYETLGSFLQRRLAPAMRTCQSVEERQANLSRKLARATSLVRSWIDVELARQNADLLVSMNTRAEHQLRLQQTVEGLSVAAISYYVVGLVGYVGKALTYKLPMLEPNILMGISVPLSLLGVGWLVHRVRLRHTPPQMK